MKEVKLNILIDKPIKEVWDYTLDSKNTPKWFASIKEEIPSELPVRLGTRLKNRGDDKTKWNEYEITEFIENKTFTLSALGSSYHVKYTFTPMGAVTAFEYCEWVDEGTLDDPTTIKTLELLKEGVENNLDLDEVTKKTI
jgi:uncharacterized protein YndB with AHSA1/START domain